MADKWINPGDITLMDLVEEDLPTYLSIVHINLFQEVKMVENAIKVNGLHLRVFCVFFLN